MDKGNQESKVLSFDGLEIDNSSHVVKVNNEEIGLSPKEYVLLLILVESKGQTISREQLLNRVWGYDYFGGLRTVDTHINRLRIKLGQKDRMPSCERTSSALLFTSGLTLKFKVVVFSMLIISFR